MELLMETPPQVEFQGMEPIPESQARVLERIAHIEERYGRITAFRVVVKAPGAHHRTSGHYEVNVRMALPDGREIAVTRTATADERFLDLDFAIDDAFKRARRRLQDQVRRMRGQIKAHAAHPIGTVAKLWPELGYGFVLAGDGREIYFIATASRTMRSTVSPSARASPIRRRKARRRPAGEPADAARQLNSRAKIPQSSH